jgi:hypothetical protein
MLDSVIDRVLSFFPGARSVEEAMDQLPVAA